MIRSTRTEAASVFPEWDTYRRFKPLSHSCIPGIYIDRDIGKNIKRPPEGTLVSEYLCLPPHQPTETGDRNRIHSGNSFTFFSILITRLKKKKKKATETDYTWSAHKTSISATVSSPTNTEPRFLPWSSLSSRGIQKRERRKKSSSHYLPIKFLLPSAVRRVSSLLGRDYKINGLVDGRKQGEERNNNP